MQNEIPENVPRASGAQDSLNKIEEEWGPLLETISDLNGRETIRTALHDGRLKGLDIIKAMTDFPANSNIHDIWKQLVAQLTRSQRPVRASMRDARNNMTTGQQPLFKYKPPKSTKRKPAEQKNRRNVRSTLDTLTKTDQTQAGESTTSKSMFFDERADDESADDESAAEESAADEPAPDASAADESTADEPPTETGPSLPSFLLSPIDTVDPSQAEPRAADDDGSDVDYASFLCEPDQTPISKAAEQLASTIADEITAQLQGETAERYQGVADRLKVKLTDKQTGHVQKLLVLMREKRFALNSLPCGAGKTYITLAAIMADYLLDNREAKVAVLLLPRSLIAQWEEAIRELLPESDVQFVEVNKNSLDPHTNLLNPGTPIHELMFGALPEKLTFVLVSVAAICTTNARMTLVLSRLNRFRGTVVVDECHLSFRKNDKTAVNALRFLHEEMDKHALVLLSATPVCNLNDESSNTLQHASYIPVADKRAATLSDLIAELKLTDRDCSVVLRALSVQDTTVERVHANSFTFFVATPDMQHKSLRTEQHGNGVRVTDCHKRYQVATGFLLYACQAGWSVGFAADNKTGLEDFADFLREHLPPGKAGRVKVFVLTSKTSVRDQGQMQAAIDAKEQLIILMTTQISTGRNFQCLRMIVLVAILPIVEFMEQIWGRIARRKQDKTTLFLVLVNTDRDQGMLDGLVEKRRRSQEYYRSEPRNELPDLSVLTPCQPHQTGKVWKMLEDKVDSMQTWEDVEQLVAHQHPRLVPWRLFTHINDAT